MSPAPVMRVPQVDRYSRPPRVWRIALSDTLLLQRVMGVQPFLEQRRHFQWQAQQDVAEIDLHPLSTLAATMSSSLVVVDEGNHRCDHDPDRHSGGTQRPHCLQARSRRRGARLQLSFSSLRNVVMLTCTWTSVSRRPVRTDPDP